MNIPKKIFFISIILFCLAGCEKHDTARFKAEPVYNEQFLGTWERIQLAESRLARNPESPDDIFGTAYFEIITTQTFFPDGAYQAQIEYRFQSFCPEEDTVSVPEADLRQYFDRILVIKGIYQASADELKIYSKDVVLPSGDTVPFEEYAAVDGSVGSAVQTFLWQITGEELCITMVTGLIPETTRFHRMGGDIP